MAEKAGTIPKTDPDRSRIMRAIKGADTGPELRVRRILREIGFSGYRLHRRDLPGKPDVVFVGRKKVIMIHGCFWHGHECPRGNRIPRSNQDYWRRKIERNRERDATHIEALSAMGWKVFVVWECEIRGQKLAQRLLDFMETKYGSSSMPIT